VEEEKQGSYINVVTGGSVVLCIDKEVSNADDEGVFEKGCCW
jgi:hypothetical protein